RRTTIELPDELDQLPTRLRAALPTLEYEPGRADARGLRGERQRIGARQHGEPARLSTSQETRHRAETRPTAVVTERKRTRRTLLDQPRHDPPATERPFAEPPRKHRHRAAIAH